MNINDWDIVVLYSECRQILLPMILRHTGDLMENKEELDDCITVLSDIMHNTFNKLTVST